MKPTTPAILVFIAATLACEAASRNVGDLQPKGSEAIDLDQAADDMCTSIDRCCALPESENEALYACTDQLVWSLEEEAKHAASLGMQADPACFERLAECGPTMAERALECHRPCKLYFGTKGLGEECSGLSDYDECAQGLVCQRYDYEEYDCGPGNVGTCSDDKTRCVDPCASQTGVPCQSRDYPSTCGPEAYCDGPVAWDSVDYGTCRPRGAIGAPCDPQFGNCLAGSFCDPSALGGPTCVATLVDGMPCTGNYQCASQRCGEEWNSEVQVGLCEPTLSPWCGGHFE